jgi:hypothetical protein
MREFRGKRGAKKNLRAKQRNAERKAANIAKAPKSWRERGLNPEQRIGELDRLHGVGVGASAERARLDLLTRMAS